MKSVLDTQSFHFDIPKVQEHGQFPPSRIIEDWSAQEKLKNFWQNEYAKAHKNVSLSNQQISEMKLNRVRFLADYAFKNTTFYRSLYTNAGFQPGDIRSWNDFEQLPIVNKEDLLANEEAVVASPFNKDKMFGVRTSGSTGKPLSIYLDDNRAHIDTLHRIRSFELLAGKPLPTDGWIYNIHHTTWWYTSMHGQYPTFTIRQSCPTDSMIEHIKKLRPKVISGLPSAIQKLAESNLNLQKLGVSCVSTNSEASSQLMRDQMSQIFQVPVGDEYSSEELGLIATQCRFGHYHLVEDECHLETVDIQDHGLGKMIGTDLWNIGMPMIRYNQRDFASISSRTTCPCGSSFRILDRFEGRMDQNFINRHGATIWSSDLLDLCDEYFVPTSSSLQEFKLVQKERNRIELIYISHSDDINYDLISQAKIKLSQIMQDDVILDLIRVNQMPENKSYKRRMVISELYQK
jgi:phenylacetate-CoA ligase